MNASNTSSSLLPTKFSQLPNLHTFITSSLFRVLVVLALHPSLPLLSHLHHPLLKLLIAPFGMLHRVSGVNSPYLFVNLILVLAFDSAIPSPITSSYSVSSLCSSITPSVFHSWLKTYLFYKSNVVTPRSSTFSSRTAFTYTFACTVSSELQ